MIFEYIARKIAPLLPPRVDIILDNDISLKAEMHDFQILAPGNKTTLLEFKRRCLPWLVLDLSDFTFGKLTVTISLKYRGSYVTYYNKKVENAELAVFDIRLPPCDGVKVDLHLHTGNKAKFAYHFYAFDLRDTDAKTS